MLKNRLLKILSIVAVLLVMVVANMYAIAWSYQKQSESDYTYGISFSTIYAEELNLDWREAYEAILRDLGVKNIRLMSYWTTIETAPDQYDYSELDWQFEKAQEYSAKVSLAVGQRQPRWPECHVPDWASKLSRADYDTQIVEFIARTVERYKNHPNLESFQLENEAANRHFGDCSELDRRLLQREFDKIRELAPDVPIVINASNQSGVPINEPIGDKIGFSIYKRAHFNAAGQSWRWSFWYVPTWWHAFRAGLVEGYHPESEAFIHELQAEPWGPVATADLDTYDQYDTMDSEKFVEIVRFAQASGMEEIYLWGAEWWYWRLVEFDDDTLWQTAKEIMRGEYEN